MIESHYKRSRYLSVILFFLLTFILFMTAVWMIGHAYASTEGIANTEKNPLAMKWAFIAAALST